MSEKDVFCAVSTLGAGAGTVESVLGAVFYFLLKEDKQFLGRLSRSLMRRFSGSGFVCGYVVTIVSTGCGTSSRLFFSEITLANVC